MQIYIMMRKFLVVVFLNFFLFLVFSPQGVSAANTIMAPVPISGSFEKPFTVNLVIDGHGEKFNAAQATVSISSNLVIKDLTLGDCNLSFLHTPSVQNPSFAGVFIAKYQTKCTVYSLSLVPVAKGKASIKLSKASVKRYGDAVEILFTAKDGSYALTRAIRPSTDQLKSSSQNGLYTLYLKVSSGGSAVNNAIVALNNVSAKKQEQATIDNTGTAHFSNLQGGVYDAVVKQGFIKVGEAIINVSGSNKVLTLGINLDAQKNNPLMKLNSLFNNISTNPLLLVDILVIGIIGGVVVAIIAIRLMGRKRRKH